MKDREKGRDRAFGMEGERVRERVTACNSVRNIGKDRERVKKRKKDREKKDREWVKERKKNSEKKDRKRVKERKKDRE